MNQKSPPEALQSRESEAIKLLAEAQVLEAKAIEDSLEGHPEKAVAEAAEAAVKTTEAIEDLAAEHAHPRGEIHFSVDGEHYKTHEHHQTPNHIIKHFGERDPATNYLVQFTDHGTLSYEGKGTVPIKLHDGDKFSIMSTGPTPVSDGIIRVGVDLFMDGLRNLGYAPTILAGKPDHILFDYKIECGSRTGQTIKLGFIVGKDFPTTCPGGPHVSPVIYATQSGGTHPTGGIHPSDFGGGWQYWSRPYPPSWKACKAPVAAYMNHIWKLWATQ